ncbi:hypothetical protein AC579_6144 [Pseudocercospora musae]|uniref:Uncharacterized protein n=1 Tax=Pseudocercospora musae TaxID=113226 RepID=A0A139IM38_9PEZI|nr:hypothetical protein AC579_6144 [Pseudocercospora musae]
MQGGLISSSLLLVTIALTCPVSPHQHLASVDIPLEPGDRSRIPRKTTPTLFCACRRKQQFLENIQ